MAKHRAANGQFAKKDAGALVRARPSALSSGPYHGASMGSQDMAMWRPYLGSADGDFLPNRSDIVARARDLVRNDGAAAAAVTRGADLVVGHRWLLASKPDREALGIDREACRVLARQMETQFRKWADDPRKFCDRRRRQNFASLLTMMARQLVGPEGESLAIMGFKARPGARFNTTIEVIDPDRLSNPGGLQDTDWLRGGVELDEDGAPVGVHIRKRHPNDVGYGDNFVWEFVPWETEWGRPIVLHHFEHERAGQNRGVSRFASVLAGFKQLSRQTEAEMATALLNAMMAGFVKTNVDPATVAQSLGLAGADATGMNNSWQDLRAEFYGQTPVTMNGVRIPVLLPGDEVELNTAERSTGSYVQFRAAFLSQIASTLGLSYEQLAMDFSRTNYSSARAALNEVWRTVTARRANLGAGVANPCYMAVMEEAFDSGFITPPPGAPPFEEAPDAYCACLWIGPSRGYIDPLKDRQANQTGIDACLMTLEQACAENGDDYEDTLDQLALEAEQRKERGLPPGGNPANLALVPASEAPAVQPAPGDQAV